MTPHSLISFRNCDIHEVLLVGMGLAQRQRHDTSTDRVTSTDTDSHRRQSTPLRSMQPGRPRLRELGSIELTTSSRRRILCARCGFGKGAAGFARDGYRDRDTGESSRRVTRRSPIFGRRVLGARLLARRLLRVEGERTRRLLHLQHTRTRCTRSSSRRW